MKRLLLITTTALISILGFAKAGPDFSPNQDLTVCGPTDVFFVCMAPENPDNIWWDFGDGSQGTGINPIHRYTSTGVFTVKMVVQKAGVKDSITKVDFITLKPKPVASFIADLTEVPIPYQRKFKFTGMSNADSMIQYTWTVNGVNVAATTSFLYKFQANGVYAASLKVTNNKGCSDEFFDSVTVNDDGRPSGIAELSASEKLTVAVNVNQPVVNITRKVSVNEEAVIDILDITGRVVYHTKMNKGESSVQLRTDELRPGAYIVELSSQSFTAAKRFDKIML